MKSLKYAALLFLVSVTGLLQAQEEETNNSGELYDMSMEQLLNLEVYQEGFQLYGYINSNFEKVFAVPGLDGNRQTIKEDSPKEWSPIKAFHIYGQGNLSSRISVLFNLAANDGGLEVRNAWGNFRIKKGFQIRVGKIYRKFGLYNHKLDQIPTFVGIEPPELFDNDHLFLTRTTDFMVHGNFGKHCSYAITTGNSEGGAMAKMIPMGWNLDYKNPIQKLTFGTSGYISSLNDRGSTSTVGFGEGSPDGGILPWMDSDNFSVMGVFVEKKFGKILVQSEYWISNHNAVRNPEHVLTLVREAGINQQQRENFLGENADRPNDELTDADVVTNVNYTSNTFYVRVAYELKTERGLLIPYLFYDWMSNPEVIQNKSFGGDNEAGFADDGKFSKPSIGLVYRPNPTVAIKVDGGMHIQKFNGQTETYPEIRLDFSFAFDVLKNLR